MMTSATEFGIASAYQNYHASNISFSNMIGQGDIFTRTSQMGENLAGRGLAGAASMGGTLFTGASSLLGLDPMSMGFGAATRAWGAGAGVMGTAAAGIGMATGVGIAGAGVGFVGNQMYQGAQQQQALNQTMRGFNYMNPQGGMGFTAGQSANVGQMMRSMTHEVGPLGELTNMNELTKLAGNMSKMGMAQNLRGVEDFKDKFKTMVTTLKKMATDLGSTMEEAQKAMAEMKRSGIFRAGDQTAMTGMMRTGALGAGVAMSEISAMSGIGSQISRSIGGTGRQGAFGGATAITQVGAAMKVGALSEEDVYNATGLTGAEGRQAFATTMMSNSARFLSQRGRGRYFLASLAGKDGRLNEDAVNEWMTGGMDPGRTAQLAYQNLNGVGRANFIRNEGRLRGAVLEKFGGMAQTMAYQQWLSSKGFNPDNMDDRSMLAFQRFSGMGRDEADNAIKMVQSLPEMMQQMRESQTLQASGDRMATQRAGSGMMGLKRKVEQKRELITGKLQQFGADLFNEGTETINRVINTVLDQYERRAVDDIDDVMRVVRGGGTSAKKAYNSLTKGVGPGGTLVNPKGTLGDSRDKELAQQNALMRTRMMSVRDEGGQSASATESFFVKNNAEKIRNMYASGLSGGSSSDRTTEYIKMLRQATDGGDQSAAELLDEMKDPAKRDAMIRRMERASGIDDKFSISSALSREAADMREKMNKTGTGRTAPSMDRAIGKALLGPTGSGGFQRQAADVVGRLGAGGVALFEGLTNAAMGAAEAHGSYDPKEDVGSSLSRAWKGAKEGWNKGTPGSYALYEGIRDYINNDAATETAAGAYARSGEGRRLIGGLGLGDGESVVAAQQKMMQLQLDKSQGRLDKNGETQLRVLQNARAGGLLLQKGEGMNNMSGQEQVDLLKQAKEATGKDWTMDDLRRAAAGIVDATSEAGLQNAKEFSDRARDDIDIKTKQLEGSGIAERKKGRWELKGRKQLKGAVGEAADIAMNMASLGISGDPSLMQGENDAYQQYYEMYHSKLSDMSMAEKKELAKTLKGTDFGMMAGESVRREERMKGLVNGSAYQMQGRAGHKELAAAKALGFDIDASTAGDLSDTSEAYASRMLAIQGGGLTGKEQGFDDYQKKIAEGLKQLRSGNMGKAGDLFAEARDSASPEVRKKLEETKANQDPGVEAARNTAANTKEAVATLKNMMIVMSSINDKTAAAAKVVEGKQGP